MKLGPMSETVSNELEELWPDLLRFARSMSGNPDLAQDIAQESMARALQREGGISDIVNLRGWLCRIATNVFREWWRKRSREHEHLQQFSADRLSSPDVLPSGMLEQRERLESIWKFIQTLPEVQRQVIQLHLVENYSHSEIAIRLNTTTENVKANLSLARRKLREKFLNP